MPRAAARAGDGLHLVEDHGRGLFALACGGLEAHRVDRAVHLGYAEYLGDLLFDGRPLAHVDRLAAEGTCLRQPLLVEVAHDDDGGAE